MAWSFNVGRGAIVIGLAGALIVAVACSSDDKDKGSSSSGSSPAAAAAAASPDASGNMTIVAKDNSYSAGTINVKAGQKVNLTLDNEGAAIHNIAILNQKGPDGQDIQTPLINAKQKGSLEFTLPAGTYDFYCSVHAAEMRGKIVAQ